MSTAWAKGSTTAWRKTRMHVLNRDRWVCQLCHTRIDTTRRPPDPWSAAVHHTRGKAYGDDPRYLVATHMRCNRDAGQPDATDPTPKPRTRW